MNVKNLTVSIGGGVSPDAGGDDGTLKRMVVRAIQPITPGGPTGGGSMVLKDVELVAPPGQHATIGGLPADAPAGYVAAPITIEHAILDDSIVLGPNVTVDESSVTRRGHSTPPQAQTDAAEDNDGSDSRRPILPSEDEGFVDRRHGEAWGIKCFESIRRGKWGWAKAECDRGMRLNPPSPSPLAQLLFNEGLIAEHAGDKEAARRFLTQSLEVRASDDDAGIREVQRVLGRLDRGQ
jgi:hypothetical protein